MEPEIDDIFRSDFRWILLMNNRNYFKQFMDAIIKTNKLQLPICYHGNFFYANQNIDVTSLIDPETHDVVGGKSKVEIEGPQHHYHNISEYFKDYPPKSQCFNFYFIGDIHSEGEGTEFPVHWNCMIYLTYSTQRFIQWFDPALGVVLENQKYNFSQKKKNAIINYFQNLSQVPIDISDILCYYRPQRVCTPYYDCVDSFCNTWCLMFASAFVENLLEIFINLPYNQYGNMILKSWLYCFIGGTKSLKDWVREMNTQELRHFNYCRLAEIEGKTIYTQTEKVREIKRQKGKTCLESVFEVYK